MIFRILCIADVLVHFCTTQSLFSKEPQSCGHTTRRNKHRLHVRVVLGLEHVLSQILAVSRIFVHCIWLISLLWLALFLHLICAFHHGVGFCPPSTLCSFSCLGFDIPMLPITKSLGSIYPLLFVRIWI